MSAEMLSCEAWEAGCRLETSAGVQSSILLAATSPQGLLEAASKLYSKVGQSLFVSRMVMSRFPQRWEASPANMFTVLSTAIPNTEIFESQTPVRGFEQ